MSRDFRGTVLRNPFPELISRPPPFRRYYSKRVIRSHGGGRGLVGNHARGPDIPSPKAQFYGPTDDPRDRGSRASEALGDFLAGHSLGVGSRRIVGRRGRRLEVVGGSLVLVALFLVSLADHALDERIIMIGLVKAH